MVKQPLGIAPFLLPGASPAHAEFLQGMLMGYVPTALSGLATSRRRAWVAVTCAGFCKPIGRTGLTGRCSFGLVQNAHRTTPRCHLHAIPNVS